MEIALVGNQNSGKSTLFNTLTGANQKIGNWPGVTVEKKTGTIKGTNYELIDLPGTYSLNPYTKEEAVTTEFIYKEEIDAIINVIDCNSIARGLYLTMQLLDLNKNVIVALNMYDIAEKKGTKIDEEKLSESLGNIPVVKISALTGKGIENVIFEISQIKNKQHTLQALKIEYNDKEIESKYKAIDVILNKVRVIKSENNDINRVTITDKLDKIFLNKFLGIPIFALIMFVIYYFSIDVIGNTTSEWINSFITQLTITIKNILIKTNVTSALISLLIDGIISGVSAVISFLPQLIFLFISISCLEKIGYMSRVSLIFDKLLKSLGMSGNSIISFILGTGCSVPRNNGDEDYKK